VHSRSVRHYLDARGVGPAVLSEPVPESALLEQGMRVEEDGGRAIAVRGEHVLKRLHIANFKSWRQLEDFQLGAVTGLIWRQQVGKTSILQSLLMLRQTVESSDRQQVLHFGSASSLIDLGGFQDVVFSHNTELPLEIGLEWSTEKPLTARQSGRNVLESTDLGFSAKVVLDSTGALAVANFEYKLGDAAFTIFSKGSKYTKYDLTTADPVHLKRTQGRAWPLPKPYKFYGFPDQVRQYYQDPSILSDLELSLEQVLSSIQYLGPLRDYPERQYQWSGAQPSDMGSEGSPWWRRLLLSSSAA